MCIITDLTRMWLTRSRKPFTFTNEYDEKLPYADCQGLGLYVHIPFCRKICAFCPYCKVVYEKEKCDHYVTSGKKYKPFICSLLYILSDLTVVIMPVVFNVVQMNRAFFNHYSLLSPKCFFPRLWFSEINT